MRKVNFVWASDSLVVEETLDTEYRKGRYNADEMLCKIGGIVGDAWRDFVEFLNMTIPDNDVACLIISGRKAVVYGISDMRISILIRDGIVSAHCGDMPSEVSRIIRAERGKNIIAIV